MCQTQHKHNNCVNPRLLGLLHCRENHYHWATRKAQNLPTRKYIWLQIRSTQGITWISSRKLWAPKDGGKSESKFHMGLRAKRQFWIVTWEEIHISYNSNVISPKLAPKFVNSFGFAFSNKITHGLKTRDVLSAITSPLLPFSLSLTSIKLVSYIWKRLLGLSLNTYSYKLMWEEAGGWSAVHSSLQIRNWRGTVSITRSLETYFPSIPSFHLAPL